MACQVHLPYLTLATLEHEVPIHVERPALSVPASS